VRYISYQNCAFWIICVLQLAQHTLLHHQSCLANFNTVYSGALRTAVSASVPGSYPATSSARLLRRSATPASSAAWASFAPSPTLSSQLSFGRRSETRKASLAPSSPTSWWVFAADPVGSARLPRRSGHWSPWLSLCRESDSGGVALGVVKDLG